MNGVDFLLSVGCCRRCALIHCGVRNYAYFGSSSCVDAKLDEIRRSNRQFGALDFNAPNSFTSNLETNQDEPQITSLNLKPSDQELISNDDMEEGMGQNQTICVSCIGLLQEFGCSMEVISKVCERALAENYDATSFSLNISLPVSMSVRGHVLAAHFSKHNSGDTSKVLGAGVTTAIKDAWKAIVSSVAASILKKRYAGDAAELSVPCSAVYDADAQECAALMSLIGYSGPTVKRQRNRRQRFYKNTKKFAVNNNEETSNENHTTAEEDLDSGLNDSNFAKKDQDGTMKSDDSETGYSRQTVETVFSGHTVELVTRLCPLTALCVPHTSISLVQETPVRETVYVAGRYCKYSRELCQTPWVVNGVQKCSESVEELISAIILPAFKAPELKFLSSGREDVDVRCVGRGRPFALCILNARTASHPPREVRRLQEVINSSTPHISVAHLQIVDKESTSVLRYNTENKVKNYCALCLVRGDVIVTAEFLQPLQGCTPLVVMQQTPLRVLHRRPLLTRPRTLHAMSVERVNDKFFKVHVRTEAGMYVKELVHGDFGRTTPNLSLLLACPVDIVALDVTNVELDWPKEVTEDDAC